MHIQPYLFFNGRCEEALEFYRDVLGAQILMSMRYKDSPEPIDPARVPPGFESKVMHMSFRIGDSTLMASDGCAADAPRFNGFALTLTTANDAEAERVFKQLADGGQVQQPLIKTFFSSSFGMVADRFGISWMVLVAQ